MLLDLSQTSWFSNATDLEPSPSVSMHSWLTKPYVLGNALEKGHGSIQVQVLSESFETPFDHEKAFLDKNEEGSFFVREVYLKNQEKVLTYGRVVIPFVTYKNNESKIVELKDKSFGKHILYSHPNCTRGEFEYACTQYQNHPLWGRRSLFRLNDDPLIVTEFYMTDLGSYPE